MVYPGAFPASHCNGRRCRRRSNALSHQKTRTFRPCWIVQNMGLADVQEIFLSFFRQRPHLRCTLKLWLWLSVILRHRQRLRLAYKQLRPQNEQIREKYALHFSEPTKYWVLVITNPSVGIVDIFIQHFSSKLNFSLFF